MPLKIDGSGLDDLMNHKHVMESFRNYQIKLLQTGTLQLDAPLQQ
jgi:hypothetical protein